MFDDEPLAIARVLRAAERSLIVIDRHPAGQVYASHDIDVPAMAREDLASWEHWAWQVRALRSSADYGWLPMMLGWFSKPPLVMTSLIGREPIRAGADLGFYIEVHGSLERLVCSKGCGVAQPSIANDDLNDNATKLMKRFGRCKGCAAPAIPSAGDPTHESVRFANDRALDAWRSATGRTIALMSAEGGPLEEQGMRLAQAANASVIRVPEQVSAWVKKVDYALTSLTWGAPSTIPIAIGSP